MRKILLFAIILFAVQTSAYKYNLIERPNNSFSLSENNYLYAPIEGDVLPGSGTQADPYRIITLKELRCLAYRVNVKHETFQGKYVRLDNNITIGKTSNWVPIGVDENYPFMGYFDGNNNTITRMKIEVGDGSGAYCYGLFGCCKGFVRNLNITDSDILFSIEYLYTNTQSISAGLLCGKLGMSRSDDAYGAIYGCTVSNGSITGTATNGTTTREDRTWIGGLVGYADDPVSIYRCHTDVTFNLRGAFDVGGIVGHICGYSVAQIQHWQVHQGPLETFVFDCTAKVNMTVTKGYIDYYHAGGICGTNDGSNIEACAATGAVTAGEDGTAAGICGRNMGNIIACVAMTTITGGYDAGGIVGKNENRTIGTKMFFSSINNSVFSGHVDGTSAQYVGGIAARCEPPIGAHDCLFLGTMKASNVSSYSNAIHQTAGGNSYIGHHCYFDGNLCQVYSKGGKTSISDLTTTTLDPNKVELGTFEVSTLKEVNSSIQIEGVSWGLVSGFYPRVVIGSANNTRSGVMTDTAIERAKNAWSDETDLKTPTLFPSYTWLPTVPVGGFTNAHEAYHLDVAFSLADKSGSDNTATYSLPNNQTALTVAGTTATPSEPGTVMMTISQGGLSKKILLNIATGKQWGGYFNNAYLGNGTAESPYLIHNANQFAAAMKENYYNCLYEGYENKKYYKLTQDIWFNDDLIGNDGKPKNGKQNWDRSGDNQYNLNWYGHLDGDGHLVHGLYVSNVYGIFNNLVGDASIENIGFVNTYVKAPASSSSHGLGFLCCTAEANAVIRNCLFEGQLDGNNNAYITSLAGVCNQLDANSTTIEDCAVAVNMSNHYNGTALFNLNGQEVVPSKVKRILVLKNCPGKGMSNSPITLTDCHFPEGYRRYDDYNRNEKVAVGTMTNGEFFKEHDKWQTAVGRFPMLKTFADSDYGKLLSLPIYTSNANNLLTIKNLLEFEKGAASWSVENTDTVNLIEDLELMEPITPFTETHLIRTLGAAKDVTTIGVINEPNFTPGITFQDDNAKTFCKTEFGNHDDTINLSELVGVASSSFTTAFANSAVANSIVRFPELRYFAAVDDLDKVFQNKTNLQEVTLPVKIRELEDDLFSGCSSMTSFTMPASITTLSTHPFYGSAIQNFEVEKNHPTFDVRDGLLMNKEKNELVSYPSARAADADHSITLSGKIDKIRTNAIYKHQGVDHLFIDAPDYNSYTELAEGGITSSTGELMTIYVKDATNELTEDERINSNALTGEGKGYLLEQFKGAECWSAYKDAGKLKRYFELDVSANSRDADNSCYWATMYIGFDTQLPEGLTAYVVDKDKTKQKQDKLVLRKINSKVPMLTPVVIQAAAAGKYKLYPLEESKLEEFPMYDNLLNGVGRDGLSVNQSQAIDGGCLTLGRNSQGKIGFFIYNGAQKIPAYRAYLTVNKVQSSRLLEISDDEPTAVKPVTIEQTTSSDAVYDLQGRKVNGQSLKKGLYIHDGKKVIVK